MDAAWQYPFAVDSIANAHPDLPPYIDHMPWLHLAAQKHEGDPFDPQAALQAETTARALIDISSMWIFKVMYRARGLTPLSNCPDHEPDVTPAVLRTAMNRAHMLRKLGKSQFPTTGLFINQPPRYGHAISAGR